VSDPVLVTIIDNANAQRRNREVLLRSRDSRLANAPTRKNHAERPAAKRETTSGTTCGCYSRMAQRLTTTFLHPSSIRDVHPLPLPTLHLLSARLIAERNGAPRYSTAKNSRKKKKKKRKEGRRFEMEGILRCFVNSRILILSESTFLYYTDRAPWIIARTLCQGFALGDRRSDLNSWLLHWSLPSSANRRARKIHEAFIEMKKKKKRWKK